MKEDAANAPDEGKHLPAAPATPAATHLPAITYAAIATTKHTANAAAINPPPAAPAATKCADPNANRNAQHSKGAIASPNSKAPPWPKKRGGSHASPETERKTRSQPANIYSRHYRELCAKEASQPSPTYAVPSN